MSAIKTQCPSCSKAFGVLERQMGHEVRCPHCGQKVRLPDPEPRSAQDEAIAQMFGDAPAAKPASAAGSSAAVRNVAATPVAPPPPAPPVEEEPPANEREAAALSALDQAFGPPSKPAKPARPAAAAAQPSATRAGASKAAAGQARPAASAKPAAAKQPTSGRAAAGMHSALSRTLGEDDGTYHDPMKNAAIHNKSTFAIFAAIMAVVVIIVIVGFVSVIGKNNDEKVAAQQQALAEASTLPDPLAPPVKPPKYTVDGKEITKDEAIKIQRENEAVVAAAPERQPDPLVIHYYRSPSETVNYEIGAQQMEAMMGYAENPGTTVVRRAALNLVAFGQNSKQEYGAGTIIFRDVQPGEKVFFAFEYKYPSGNDPDGLNYQKQCLGFDPIKPEYQFEVAVRKINPEFKKSVGGLIMCEVTNRSAVKADEVEIFLALYDQPDLPPIGFCKSVIYNLKANEAREVPISWRYWSKDAVRSARGRAQIAEENPNVPSATNPSGQMTAPLLKIPPAAGAAKK